MGREIRQLMHNILVW